MRLALMQRWLVFFAATLACTTAWSADLCLVPAGGKDCSGFPLFSNHISTRGYSEDGTPCAGGSLPGHAIFVSRSQVDPYASVGPLDEPELFLWAAGEGYGFREGVFSIHGNIEVTGLEAIIGHIDFYISPSNLFWGGCVFDEPMCVARLIVSLPVPVQAPSWGRVKALYR